MEKVKFETTDGYIIVGEWFDAKSDKAAILLHMMPATKESWHDFVKELNRKSISALAIDLRGHGESTRKADGSMHDFNKFSNQEHEQSINDVIAAEKWLKGKGAKHVFAVGASIGANLALQFQELYNEVKKSVLLSPGLNYRGIETIPFARNLKNDQAVFIAASTKDTRAGGGADIMAGEIADAVKSRKELKIFDSDKHGTDIFKDEPQLIHEIVEWLALD